MECTAVVRTSQNGQLFIKSSILVLRYQHSHDICLLADDVNTIHRVDNYWYILVLGLEQSVRQCEKHYKTMSFSSSL